MADEEEEPLLPPAEPPPDPPSAAWRNGAAFWILGLCNNLPYVLMLSAARDILELQQGEEVPHSNSSRYDCNQLSTGAVLLADVLPSMLIKLLVPLAPHWLSCDRLIGQRSLGAGGGDSADGDISVSHGLSPVLGLGHWSRRPLGGAMGRGGAGGGAWPVTCSAACGCSANGDGPEGALPDAFPLAVVYFAEYFINQGVLDLLYFPTSSLSHNDQYRWSQLLYQAGVFASRSGFRFLQLQQIWGLMGLQVLNAAILLAAVLVPFLPAVGVAFALVLWEGLVGGVAYGSAYLRVGQRAPPGGRGLAVAVTSLGESLGVALAGVAAMGLHRELCAP
uniref:Battenin n=1 Tax=Melopsittacus undulatus TaxID=13146 RepID=A0A8V5H2J2_MELUD